MPYPSAFMPVPDRSLSPAPMFGAIRVSGGQPVAPLVELAREFSPRIAVFDTEVVLDLSGLSRLFGTAQEIADALQDAAAANGVQMRVAIASTRTAARLLVPPSTQSGFGGASTVVVPGREASALAPLPLEVLTGLMAAAAGQHASQSEEQRVVAATLRRWGILTLGALAALPADALSARLGHQGIRWQRAARGEDPGPFVPSVPEERFEQALDLEWPIEGLEPLSFVLGPLLEPLSAHLERRGRAAAVLHVRLHLVTRQVHERTLELPMALRDPRTLRTLLMLDLESHPPEAGIDRVVVAVDPTPERTVQCSLLTKPLPAPEQISTLMARLGALMGSTRCGAPAPVDSWEPGAFALRPFAPVEMPVPGVSDRPAPFSAHDSLPAASWPTSPSTLPPVTPSSTTPSSTTPSSTTPSSITPSLALRRFRVPIIARVQVEQGRPVRVLTDRREWTGGRVEACAGPWRTSGQWWLNGEATPQPGTRTRETWDRDEWEVSLADGGTYRIFRERLAGRWFIDAVVD